MVNKLRQQMQKKTYLKKLPKKTKIDKNEFFVFEQFAIIE